MKKLSYEERYLHDKEKERKRAERQVWVYEHRDWIKVGDKFRWRKSRHPDNGNDWELGYITSGRCRQNLMCVFRDGPYWQDEMTLTVCKVFEGRNSYGPFVDYWMSFSGKIEYGDDGKLQCLILNGPDAFRMERVE